MNDMNLLLASKLEIRNSLKPEIKYAFSDHLKQPMTKMKKKIRLTSRRRKHWPYILSESKKGN